MVRLVSCAAAVILAAGCAKQRPADGAMPDNGWPREELAMIRALSVRDPEPDCAVVEAMVPDPVASLIKVTRDVPQPPWVSLRAASCLVSRHAEEAQDTIRDWVVDEDLRGLATIALQSVDEMPEHVAEDVLRDALAGPFATEAADAAGASERRALRALLGDEAEIESP